MKQKLILGVTGHRKLLNIDSLINVLHNKLQKLSNTYFFEAIISPLADGSDRIVAKILMDDFNAKLIVPLPFEKNEYKKDFSVISQKEFENFLIRSSRIYETGSLKDTTRNECYLNAGKEVVDQSDLLIALWNGKEANGIGGTGDIMKYAKENKKSILYINTKTFNVEGFLSNLKS